MGKKYETNTVCTFFGRNIYKTVPTGHRIKPTFGFLYIPITLLPHKSFVRSKGQFTITLQKQFPFGNLQITLFNKNIAFAQDNALPPVAVTVPEKMRRLPVRSTKWLDVAYSEGTIFASINLFEKQKQITVFQGISVQPRPLHRSSTRAGTIVSLVPLAFALSYDVTVLPQVNQRVNREVIVRFRLGG